MQQRIDGMKFYQTLVQAFAQVKERVQQAGGPVEVRMTIWAGYGKDIRIDLDSGYGSNGIKVGGKDLEALTSEFIRRHGFMESQEALQLTGPEMEGEFKELPVAGPTEKADDEIPF